MPKSNVVKLNKSTSKKSTEKKAKSVEPVSANWREPEVKKTEKPTLFGVNSDAEDLSLLAGTTVAMISRRVTRAIRELEHSTDDGTQDGLFCCIGEAERLLNDVSTLLSGLAGKLIQMEETRRADKDADKEQSERLLARVEEAKRRLVYSQTFLIADEEQPQPDPRACLTHSEAAKDILTNIEHALREQIAIVEIADW